MLKIVSMLQVIQKFFYFKLIYYVNMWYDLQQI